MRGCGKNLSLSETNWHATRNAVVRESLLPIAAGLSILYFVIAVSHALLLPKPAAVPMSLWALVSGMAFTVLHFALRRWPMPSHWAHPVAVAAAGLVLVNCFLHLYLVPEPQQTTNLLLLIVGVGFLLLSTRWLAVIIITTLAGWALLVWIAPPSPDWMHFGFALYMGTILSVMVHTVRINTLRNLDRLRQQDERRKAELETALNATETARSAAEAIKQDLMQSEARLRLVANQMPAVLWTTDSELRLTSSLGMGLSALDLQPQEVLEMMRLKYSPTPEFLPIVAHRRALEGESVNYEINWKDHTFGCQVEPLHDANKKIIGTIGIAFDITARKLAEETLSKSEEQFRLIFDLAPIGMALTALDGKILRVNQAFCKTLGYTVEELLSRAFADITHPDDRTGYLAHRAQLLHGETTHFQIERRFVSKSGKIIYTLLQVGLVKDPQAAPLYFIGQALDITELKQAEEEIHQLNAKLEQRVQTRTAELRESEERYRALYEDNPSMYFTVDSAGKILSVNSFGAEQLGYRVEELIGMPVVELFDREDQDDVRQQMAVCLQNPKLLYTWELRKVHRNGQTFWVRETARATWNANGTLVIFVVCEDISRRKRLEEEIRQYTERLEQLVTERALRIQVLERQRAV